MSEQKCKSTISSCCCTLFMQSPDLHSPTCHLLINTINSPHYNCSSRCVRFFLTVQRRGGGKKSPKNCLLIFTDQELLLLLSRCTPAESFYRFKSWLQSLKPQKSQMCLAAEPDLPNLVVSYIIRDQLVMGLIYQTKCRQIFREMTRNQS